MYIYTKWFKYDRDKLWLVYTQSVPVIFKPPCIYMYIYTRVYKCVCMYVCMCVYIHVYIYTHCVYVYVCIYIHAYICVCVYTHTHTHTHTQKAVQLKLKLFLIHWNLDTPQHDRLAWRVIAQHYSSAIFAWQFHSRQENSLALVSQMLLFLPF
jgi:hypothetical protein